MSEALKRPVTLCKDCKFYWPSFYPLLPFPARCDHLLAPHDMQVGDPAGTCHKLRNDQEACGIEAKWFEPRPAPKPPVRRWWQIWGAK